MSNDSRSLELDEILSTITDRLDALEEDDTEYGDEENTNNDIITITDLNGTVSYYAEPVTHTPKARITWTWTQPVILDDAGLPDDDDLGIDPIIDYMLGTSIDSAPVVYASTGGALTGTTDGHPLNTIITGYVYAVTAAGRTGTPMSWDVEVEKDTTPPPKPSNPIVSSTASVVTVTCDGKDYLNNTMPDDTAGYIVKLSTATPPTVQVGIIDGVGPNALSLYVASHSVVYVQLFAYDYSGNVSDGSGIIMHTVKSVLDDTDLADQLALRPRFYTPSSPPGSETIPENSWWFKSDGTVWRYVSGAWAQQTFDASDTIAAGTIITSLLAAAAVTADKIAANAITADKIYAGAVTAAAIAVGAITSDKISAGAIDGLIITGATIRTAASGARVVLDSSGLHGYNSAGVEKTKVGTDGLLVADSAAFTNATFSSPPDSTWAGLININSGKLSFQASSTTSAEMYAASSGGLIPSRFANKMLIRSYSVGGLLIWSSGSGASNVIAAGNMFTGDGYGNWTTSLTVTDGLISLSASSVKLSGYPKAYVGRLAADRSLTASNYTSFKTTSVYETNATDSSFVTWNGDAATITEDGWYEVILSAGFDNSSTSGNRLLMLLLNFTSNTYNSSTVPAESYRLAEQKLAASSDTTTCILTWRGRLSTGDRLHFFARSTTAVGLGNGYRTQFSLMKLGE